MNTSAFQYELSLSKEDVALLLTKVSGIRFAISRYGAHEKTILFDERILLAEALLAAESFLSNPATKKYYEKVKGDLFHDEFTEGMIRGDFLGDCVYLERILIEDDIATIICGS